MHEFNADEILDYHSDDSTTISLAKTESEHEEVRRFWYRIYVEEMGRKQLYADHETRTIRDPYELNGHVLCARDATGLVGTVRIHFTDTLGIEEYVELYCCHHDPEFERDRGCVVTRFMVEKNRRAQRIGFALFSALYDYGTLRGCNSCYMDCNAHLIELFRSIGFLPRRVIKHPEYGEVTVMCLMPLDTEHLTQCKSPFTLNLSRIATALK